ncbi:2-dehydropantoate 2-reductase [Reinekea forsetii]|nr:2-dehydropantoate 2-reductase [Reinekea forsetii]
MKQTIHSLIVGPGAIGSLLCAHIQAHSTVWVHPHKPAMSLANEVLSKESVPLNWQLLDNPQQPIDLIWVCSKANHSEQTTSKLLTLHNNAQAILLHNGLGPQQALNKKFPGRIIYGMTTNAAFKASNGLFQQTAFGQTFLGYPHQVAPQSAAWLETITSWPGNLSFYKEANIESALWKKLAINAIVNPLTAFYQVKNGELLKSQYQSTIDKMCKEIEQVALKERQSLPTPLINTVNEVIELTAQNYSSMNRDFHYKRPTELEFILGFLLNRAQKHAIEIPTIEYWYQKIDALQMQCSED